VRSRLTRLTISSIDIGPSWAKAFYANRGFATFYGHPATSTQPVVEGDHRHGEIASASAE
jgi:hypothetical protein